MDAYFKSRQWFNVDKDKALPPTYVVRTAPAGEVVGFVALGFRNYDHPHDGSGQRAKYLVVYVAGVNVPFQGKEDSGSKGQTYAASMFDFIESQARAKDVCVGVSLWVRANNARAVAFYKKVGFEEDPGGPRQRDGGAPHLTMRKPIR